MDPQLDDLRQQVEAIRDDGMALTADLSDAQMVWRPRPDAWSITDCLAHLNVVDGQEIPQYFQAITNGRKAGSLGSGPNRWRWWERWFISSMGKKVKMKVKAPKGYLPPPSPDPDETLLEFLRIHNDLHFMMGKADGLDLKAIKVRLPQAKWIKMSIGARFDLLVAHDWRHLLQAKRVREGPGFPEK